MADADDNQAMLKVGCGYCGQEPGEWCITESGRSANPMHAARGDAAFSAHLFSWQQDERKSDA